MGSTNHLTRARAFRRSAQHFFIRSETALRAAADTLRARPVARVNYSSTIPVRKIDSISLPGWVLRLLASMLGDIMAWREEMLKDGQSLCISVDCYAGYRGEETPLRFRLGNRLIEIAEVLDRWLAPDHRYFKVRTSKGELYIIRNDTITGVWQLTLFEASKNSPSAH
jgi:hypothetical protein